MIVWREKKTPKAAKVQRKTISLEDEPGIELHARRFERLFQYTNDIVLVTGPDGIVKDLNQRAHDFFEGERHVRGKSIRTLFNGFDMAEELLRNPQIVHSFHVSSVSRSGGNRPLKLALVPVTEKGEVTELILILKDLTELESQESRIDSLRKMIADREQESRSGKPQGPGDRSAVRLECALEELKNANRELNRRNRGYAREFELAALVQKSLVPISFPDRDNLHFAFHFEPMGPVGGDYYDVIVLNDGRIGVIVADVSGHGVGAAFIAAMLKISFINQAPHCSSPSVLLGALNKEYCRLIQSGDYVTAFYTIIDPEQKTMTFSGASHPMPLLSRCGQKTGEPLRSGGFFLGMFEGAEYADTVREFGPGDRFFAYTDGIIEAFSEEKNQQYGLDRLFRCFEGGRDLSTEEFVSALIGEVKAFTRKSFFQDDLAVVAVDYMKEGKR
jgi:PAS domain S-box-containing protein